MERELAILDVHRLGLPLPEELLADIVHLDLDIASGNAEAAEPDGGPMYDGRRHLWLYKTPAATATNQEIANDPNYWDRIPAAWVEEYKDIEIERSMWTPPGAPEDLPKDLCAFVLSMNPRFDQLIPYKEFYLYCEEARRWNAETTSIEDFTPNSQEWIDYGLRETSRCQRNFLYGLDRYVTIKDDTQPGGRRKYRASTPQALLCFLKNIGVNYIIIKGRQAAITSTEMACAQLKSLVTPSYKGALVTDDIEVTGTNIFEDKFKSTTMHMPEWLRPRNVVHDTTRRIMYAFGSMAKGSKKKYTSEFSIFSPKDTQTINGTTPSDLYCDEAQNIPTLQKILMERRPTSWAEVGGEMRLLRQSFVWGTGASNNQGKGSFEDYYKQVKGSMREGKPTGGWVALFFDAFCRPYMSKSVYFREYWETYIGESSAEFKGMSLEDKQAMFASHFPMSDDDGFRGTANTVVPRIRIKEHQDRITKMYPGGPIRGYFEPIFDEKEKMPPGSYRPYRVIGATFRKAPLDDLRAPVYMFRDREEGCVDNYYQGTDPIQSDTGLSRMASTIIAASAVMIERNGKKIHVPAPVCWVNCRMPITKQTFEQVKLMGMYYRNHGQLACPELVEIEQGHNYVEFCKSPVMMCENTLVERMELWSSYQVGNHQYGISMKETSKTRAHADLVEYMDDMARYDFSYDFFSQVLTIEQDESGKFIKWGTMDVRRHNDDLVMSRLFAYINYKHLGGGKIPKRLGKDTPTTQKTMQQVRIFDPSNPLSGGYVQWVEVEEPIYDAERLVL